MARIAELVAYPLKSNDGAAVERAELGPNGALRGDRSYAIVGAGVDPHAASVGGDGGYVNGKREPAVHRLSASDELAGPTDATPTAVTLSRPARPETGVDADERTFALPEDGEAREAWVGEYLGYAVDLVREPIDGFREAFIRKRRETRPAWTESDRFDHDFRLMVNTAVPETEWGSTLAVGDAVAVEGVEPEPNGGN